MWRAAALVALLLSGCAGTGSPPEHSRSVAFTFDDLPLVSTRWDIGFQRETTAKLREACARNGIPAIGFVNERKLETNGELDPAKVELLERWLDAGFELGNHTYSHPDLHEVPLEAFTEDVVKGERITRELLRERELEPRFFRHPMLHTGRDLDTKKRLESFLAERGYRVAPVTIDNADYLFARAYDRAADREDRRTMKRVGGAYLEYMEAMFGFYEGQSRALFEREVSQILLLHANRLNADHLDRLAAMIRARGYTFVTLDHALADPVYTSEDRYTGPAGITWIHRWAITANVDPAVFRGEPVPPEFVHEVAALE